MLNQYPKSYLQSLSRRRFLQMIGVGLIPVTWKPSASASATGPESAKTPVFMSSVMGDAGQHFWQASQIFGKNLWSALLPGRGHGVAIHPNGQQAIMVGRRPADWMFVAERLLDDDLGEISYLNVKAPSGRHYFGHAQYSRDGKRLYTTENDYQQGRGVIGIYNTQNFTRIGEWLSGGVGPHELKLMNDGQHMAVANGGILTHPGRPREKLNIATMAPNLSILNLDNGQIVARYELPDQQMSIRHLDITSNNKIWVGCQYEGDSLDPLPLVAYTKEDDGLQWAQGELIGPGQGPERGIWRQLKGYCGSVCCHFRLPVVAISSPRGHHVLLWESNTGQYIRSFRLRDVCGLATDAQAGFLASTGKGEIWRLPANATSEKATLLWKGKLRWDNHMTSASQSASTISM